MLINAIGLCVVGMVAGAVSAVAVSALLGVLFGMFNRDLELGALVIWAVMGLSARIGAGLAFVVTVTALTVQTAPAPTSHILLLAALAGVVSCVLSFLALRLLG